MACPKYLRGNRVNEGINSLSVYYLVYRNIKNVDFSPTVLSPTVLILPYSRPQVLFVVLDKYSWPISLSSSEVQQHPQIQQELSARRAGPWIPLAHVSAHLLTTSSAVSRLELGDSGGSVRTWGVDCQILLPVLLPRCPV